MRAKMLTIAMTILACANAQKIVTLEMDDDTNNEDAHKNVIPVVYYNDSVVSISSKAYIGNVRIVVKDIQGNIIYNKVVDLLPNTNVLDIPKEYVNDKFKIELSYGNATLYGYFLTN